MRTLTKPLLAVALLIPLAACQDPLGAGQTPTGGAPTGSTAPTTTVPTGTSSIVPTTTPGTTEVAAITTAPGTTPAIPSGARDPWLQPFSADSIWNTPISADAEYVPSGLTPVGWHAFETDWLYQTDAADPTATIRPPGDWIDRCAVNSAFPDRQANPALTGAFSVPSDLAAIAPPMPVNEPGNFSTPNNAVAIRQPDGVTIVQAEPFQSCPDGSLVGWRVDDVRLDGQGLYGGHLGSGLSSIGGTIRTHELASDAPIPHALKANVWGTELFYDASEADPGYRWPADRADSYAASGGYSGTNPEFQMGALLALDPAVDIAALGVTDPTALRVCTALRDYGAYVVDDSGWDAHNLAYEQGAAESVGLPTNTAYQSQVDSCFSAMSVVSNSAGATPGGGAPGSSRRAPAAAPLAGD